MFGTNVDYQSQQRILKWSDYTKDVLKYLKSLPEGNLFSLNLRRSPHPYDYWSLQNLAFDTASLNSLPHTENQNWQKRKILSNNQHEHWKLCLVLNKKCICIIVSVLHNDGHSAEGNAFKLHLGWAVIKLFWV